MDLVGKTALITGGSRGIGRACAFALAQAGANIVVAARNMPDLTAVVAEIQSQNPNQKSLAVNLDVTDQASIEAALVQITTQFGGCDILVNNAGIADSAPLVKSSIEFWQSIIDVNLTGNFRCIKAVLPYMLANNWGRIINIASIAGKAGAPYISAYAASKHGVLGLTKALAQEVAHKGITVNAICPGYVETDMGEKAISNIMTKTGGSRDKAMQYLESTTPQKRLFHPDEVAYLTAMLAAPAAKGINGQAINICGGALPF